MNRFEVIENSENTAENIIANPISPGLSLADFYREKMEEAAKTQTERLCFESIDFADKKSDNFQNIYILEKCIMDFLRENSFPQKIRIVCDTKEKAELYKVVYNFYYPGSKAERLDDDKWD